MFFVLDLPVVKKLIVNFHIFRIYLKFGKTFFDKLQLNLVKVAYKLLDFTIFLCENKINEAKNIGNR
jgi:hypothetical protein